MALIPFVKPTTASAETSSKVSQSPDCAPFDILTSLKQRRFIRNVTPSKVMFDNLNKQDFELRSVVQAYRLPKAAMLCLTVMHAIVLVLLGHAAVAAFWIPAMIAADLLFYAQTSALMKRDFLTGREVEIKLGRTSLLRSFVVMSGPAAACLQTAGVGELIFLMLSVAAVSTSAVVASGYRVSLILTGFAPAFLGLIVGLIPFLTTVNFPGIFAAGLINVLLMAGILKGVSLYAKTREALALERRGAHQALVTAHSRLEEEIDAKSVFLSTLSHEVRTPLNGVMGLAEVLARSALSSEQKEQVDTILASGVMMRTILDDVLDAAKIEAGRLEISPAPTDLEGLFKQLSRVWSAPAQLKSVSFVTTIEVGQLPYNVDAVRIQQVVNNLLSNAVKFTKVGVVSLTAKISESGSGRNRLRVEIQDTGIGLSAEACDKLFGRFVQADATVAGRFGGSGVGLYVSKNLVTLMNGQIGVVSSLGQGSTFWFEIEVEPAQDLNCKEEEELLIGDLEVLAVDDNPTNRKVVQLLLESLGHKCEVVDSGAAALERMQVQPFDVILLDIRMPGLSGDETLERLRVGVGPNQHAPVIALTADAADWTDEVALARGFDGFVSKPIEVSKLAIAVCTAGYKTQIVGSEGRNTLGLAKA